MLGGAGDVVSIGLTIGQPVRVGATGNHYQYGRLVARITVDGRPADHARQPDHGRPYLYGISEVPSSWPVEALKAQAIAARTYAGDALPTAPELTFDLYSTTQDQNYTGYDKESSVQADRWIAAVNATDQQIVTYNGAPISAFYFSSSGGATENSEYVFVHTLPYSQSVADPFDNAAGNNNFRWKRSYTGAELGAWLKASRGVDLGDVTKLDFLGPFGASGRIDRSQIRITGRKGTTQITGGQLMGTINANAPDSRQLLSSLVFIKPNGSFDARRLRPGASTSPGWTYYPYRERRSSASHGRRQRGAADVVASGARGDVAGSIPGAPGNAGFDTVVPVQNATSTVCINAHLPATPRSSHSAASRSPCPRNRSDSSTLPPMPATRSASPDGPSIRRHRGPSRSTSTSTVRSGLVADRERSDLAPFLPGWGTSHGYRRHRSAQPGPHNVCAYAINFGPGSHVLLGCRDVQVLPPHATRNPSAHSTPSPASTAPSTRRVGLDPTPPIPSTCMSTSTGHSPAAHRPTAPAPTSARSSPLSAPPHGFDATFAATPGCTPSARTRSTTGRPTTRCSAAGRSP